MSELEESDRLWREDGERCGWKLPAPAAWPRRLPIIRAVRTVYYALMMERWYRFGPGALGLRSGYDEWVLYAIRRGWA